MNILPNSRPKIGRSEVEKILRDQLGGSLPPLVLVAIRGYYSKSMGATSGNDINLYDDAIAIWGLNVFKTFNANTDPSFVKKNGRALAKLVEGVYMFYKGKHKGKYDALRAYPEGVTLPCTRNGVPATCSAINIHRGGLTNGSAGVTWSEGCQTLPPSQWGDFIETVYRQMDKLGMKTIKYVLINSSEM